MSNSNTPTFSQQLPSLLQHHFEQLYIQSGIVVDVIKERGYESVLAKKRFAGLGLSKARCPHVRGTPSPACLVTPPPRSLWLKAGQARFKLIAGWSVEPSIY